MRCGTYENVSGINKILKEGNRIMKKIMFDSNALTNLLNSQKNLREFFESCSNRYEFYITAMQVEELAQIPDNKKNERITNLLCLCQMRAKLVNTIGVYGKTRYGLCCYASKTENTYQNLLNENHSNINDALIGDAAEREGCILITDDRRFITKLKNNNIPTMKFGDLINEVYSE